MDIFLNFMPNLSLKYQRIICQKIYGINSLNILFINNLKLQEYKLSNIKLKEIMKKQGTRILLL